VSPASRGGLELGGPLVLYEATEPGGAFQADGLFPGTYHVTATCLEPPSEPTPDEVYVGAESVVRTWNLNLIVRNATEDQAEGACCRPSGTVRVVVAAPDGAETQSLRVQLIRPSGEIPIRGRQQGESFTFEGLELGEYSAYVEQSPVTRQRISLDRDGQVVEVQLIAPRLTAIAGHVTDGQGQPVPDAWVRATNGIVVDRPPALTDSDGAFIVSGVFAGKYTLIAESALGAARLDYIDGDTRNVVLRIAAQGALTGSVTSATGDPVESFVVVGRRQGDSELIRANGASVWSLPSVAAGTYELAVMSSEGFASETVVLSANGVTDVPLKVDSANRGHVPDWASDLLRRGDPALADIQ
jgi:hypothetical protein